MTQPDHEILFIPGPVEVEAELRSIVAMPLIGHRNPKFVAEVQAVCDKLQLLFQTDASATGSLGSRRCALGARRTRIVIWNQGAATRWAKSGSAARAAFSSAASPGPSTAARLFSVR